MKLSIIILNWNGVDMLRRFLPSVIEHSPEAEIIVADNGSTDESLQLLAERFPDIRVLAFDRNYGFAEGYNKAIAQIECNYCLLLKTILFYHIKNIFFCFTCTRSTYGSDWCF